VLLKFAAGKTLSFTGATLTSRGDPEVFFYAPEGRIQIVSVASPGEVVPDLSRPVRLSYVDSQNPRERLISPTRAISMCQATAAVPWSLEAEKSFSARAPTSDPSLPVTQRKVDASASPLSLLNSRAVRQSKRSPPARPPGGDIALQASSIVMDGASTDGQYRRDREGWRHRSAR